MFIEENEINEEEDARYDKKFEEEEEEIISGEFLMVMRILRNQVKEEDATQRENIFHTRWLVQEKACSLIIDGWSCTNVASTHIMSILNLEKKTSF